MAVRVDSGVLHGVDARAITVEVDLLRRLPGVCMVGLPAADVRESAERVRSALVAAGETFPRMRVVVNLAPANLKKRGTSFDLPIAVGILAAAGDLPSDALEGVLLVGELSLDGRLRPVNGAVALALLARERGWRLVLPAGSASAAAAVPDVDVRAASDLGAVLAYLKGKGDLPRASVERRAPTGDGCDLSDVRGQHLARRALEIAAAGGHHVLMWGPPGCGKSMLARRLPGILPAPTFEEMLDVTRVRGAAGFGAEGGGLVSARPFRAPHNSVTAAGMIGDRMLRPGEITLAHRGVLFLDEATEFRRATLEVLRAPLEDGFVQLTRAEGTVVYPSEVMLVMAANPCPCGMLGSDLPCGCTDAEVHRYRRKLSGPILDRIDLHVELESLSADELIGADPGESTQAVRARVERARDRQRDRGQADPNARLAGATLARVVQLEPTARDFLRDAMRRLSLSGRAATRVTRLARTIADLAGSPAVHEPHLAEAIGFRPRVAL